MKYETKFFVIDDRFDGDEFVKICETLEEANEEADREWGYLTDREKRSRRIYVAMNNDGDVEYAVKNMGALDDDGNIDYETVFPSDIPDGAFDSDLISKEADDDDDQ